MLISLAKNFRTWFLGQANRRVPWELTFTMMTTKYITKYTERQKHISHVDIYVVIWHIIYPLIFIRESNEQVKLENAQSPLKTEYSLQTSVPRQETKQNMLSLLPSCLKPPMSQWHYNCKSEFLDINSSQVKIDVHWNSW